MPAMVADISSMLEFAKLAEGVKMQRLAGKNVIVTGASSGIGQAIAIRFAQEGANIAINYRSGAEQAAATAVLAQEVREKHCPGVTGKDMVVQADVSKEEEVRAMFAQVIGKMGRVDILVNN